MESFVPFFSQEAAALGFGERRGHGRDREGLSRCGRRPGAITLSLEGSRSLQPRNRTVAHSSVASFIPDQDTGCCGRSTIDHYHIAQIIIDLFEGN